MECFKIIIFFAIIINLISIGFLSISFNVTSWVKGEMKNDDMYATVKYGFKKGKYVTYPSETYSKNSTNEIQEYDIYLTCEGEQCAFSCRKTKEERLREIHMIFVENKKPNFGCDELDSVESLDETIGIDNRSLYTTSIVLFSVSITFYGIAIILKTIILITSSKYRCFFIYMDVVCEIICCICIMIVIIFWTTGDSPVTIRNSKRVFSFVPAMVGYFDDDQNIKDDTAKNYWIRIAVTVLQFFCQTLAPMLMKCKT